MFDFFKTILLFFSPNKWSAFPRQIINGPLIISVALGKTCSEINHSCKASTSFYNSGGAVISELLLIYLLGA